MSNQSTIQVRMDAKTKRAFRRTVESVGLDMSTAFNVFAKKVIAANGIPFEVRTENGFTPEQEREMIQETQWAIEHARGFKTAEELHDHILGRK